MSIEEHVPILRVKQHPDFQFQIGLPELIVDGEPVKWPTIDDWTVTFSDQGLTALTVTLPVRIEVVDEPG